MWPGKPDCKRCSPNGYKTVIQENIEVMEIIMDYFPYFFEGMGSPSLSSILLVLKLEGHEDREDLFQKLLLYVKEATRTTEKGLKQKNKIISQGKTTRHYHGK